MVDDERIVSLDIQGALSRLGYAVAGTAASGEAAIALARSAAPDLVLMDIRLEGGMDGAEAALSISREQDIPVVFLTAHSDEQTLRRALAAAPFGYLIKPFLDRELGGVIELALAKHGTERDLRRARRAAEEADRAKTAFLGTVSHELRTPLNGIMGMAELLLLSGLEGERRETVEHLMGCAQALTDILNRLIEYSSLEAGVCRLTERDFSLREFLAQAVERHSGRAQAKGLAFSLDVGGLPERAAGPPERIRQALELLLDNAVAFTDKGAVRVNARAEETADGDGAFVLLLDVEDTGPGIEPEQLPRVFDRFTQGEDFLTRRVRGLGLGLPMCRRLAERMGGSLGVESVPGRGSVFSLRVPLRRAQCPRVQCGPLGGARVLLAEGQGAMPSQLRQAIDAAGGLALPVQGGAQAARALAESAVDAVVFASSLELQDALALARTVRAGLTGIPSGTVLLAVLAGSGPGAGEHEAERCLAAGMDEVLTEPADSLKCMGSLTRLLAERANSMNPDRQGADAP